MHASVHVFVHTYVLLCMHVPILYICICVIVEAHCYFVDIGRIDREQIRSRINNNDCRTFRPRRPLSTAYRTKEIVFVCWQVHTYVRVWV